MESRFLGVCLNPKESLRFCCSVVRCPKPGVYEGIRSHLGGGGERERMVSFQLIEFY